MHMRTGNTAATSLAPLPAQAGHARATACTRSQARGRRGRVTHFVWSSVSSRSRSGFTLDMSPPLLCAPASIPLPRAVSPRSRPLVFESTNTVCKLKNTRVQSRLRFLLQWRLRFVKSSHSSIPSRHSAVVRDRVAEGDGLLSGGVWQDPASAAAGVLCRRTSTVPWRAASLQSRVGTRPVPAAACTAIFGILGVDVVVPWGRLHLAAPGPAKERIRARRWYLQARINRERTVGVASAP